MTRISTTAKVVLLFFGAVIIGFIWLIGTSIQADNKDRADREKWANECHSLGRVIVTVGGYNHCLSWEEAKEKGIELEAR